VHGTPRWGQRTSEMLYEYMLSGLVFMMEEGALERVSDYKDDWRVAMMHRVTEVLLS